MYTLNLNEQQFSNLKALLNMSVKVNGMEGNTDMAAREILGLIKKDIPTEPKAEEPKPKKK